MTQLTGFIKVPDKFTVGLYTMEQYNVRSKVHWEINVQKFSYVQYLELALPELVLLANIKKEGYPA